MKNIIVIATHNKGKEAELKEILQIPGIEFSSSSELKLPDVEETGKTERVDVFQEVSQDIRPLSA